MADNKLDQVKRLINQLTPYEQAQLLQYLTPRIAHSLAYTQPQSSREEYDAAWERFFKAGEEIAESDNPDAETLTQTLLKLRR